MAGMASRCQDLADQVCLVPVGIKDNDSHVLYSKNVKKQSHEYNRVLQ
jgi:hypothetical protein